jgi:hypothetical protein
VDRGVKGSRRVVLDAVLAGISIVAVVVAAFLLARHVAAAATAAGVGGPSAPAVRRDLSSRGRTTPSRAAPKALALAW